MHLIFLDGAMLALMHCGVYIVPISDVTQGCQWPFVTGGGGVEDQFFRSKIYLIVYFGRSCENKGEQ